MPEHAPVPVDEATSTFAARTPWTAGAATVFAALTLAAAIGIAWIAQPLHALFGSWLGGPRNRPGVDESLIANTMLSLLVVQGVVIALVWWGAARFGGDRRRLLALEPHLPLTSLVIGVGGMLAFLVPFNGAVFWLFPEQFASNLLPFWEFARSPAAGLGLLVFAVGAPVSEELLFRGFLLPALTKTRHGFRGAAIMASIGWTVLHAYTLIGLLEVFVTGLYFSWLVWRYRNIWLPMALHAAYNALQFAVLALWPTG